MFGEGQEFRCPSCLEEGTAVLRYDKRGKPYLRCRWCASTTFYGTPQGLTALLMLAPQAAELLAAGGSSVRSAQREAMDMLASGSTAREAS